MGLVQTSGIKETATGGTSVVFNAPSNFTVGNWVVLTWTTTPFRDSISTGAGTYSNIIDSFPFGSQMYGMGVFQVTNSGQSDVTFSFSSGVTNAVSCSFEEWDNFTGAIVDSVPTEGTTSITSATLSQANEVVYSIGVPNGVGSSATGPSSGFTQTWLEGGLVFANGASGYKVVSSTTAVTATYTNVGACLMATFTTSGGGGSTYTLTAGPGSYALTGQSANLLESRVVTAAQGSYSLTGQTAGLTYSVASALTATQGSYTLTGSSALVDTSMNADFGSYTLTGQPATLTFTPLNNYTLVAAQGSYALTGQASNLLENRVLVATQGQYNLIGIFAILTWSGAPVSSDGLNVTKRLYLGMRIGL